MKSKSIIDCDPTSKKSISSALKQFLVMIYETIKSVKNPYGDGNVSLISLTFWKKSNFLLSLKKGFLTYVRFYCCQTSHTKCTKELNNTGQKLLK